LSFTSLFWTVRDWMGFENLCLAFYDQSALVEEMFEFLTDFYIATLQRGIVSVKIDMVELKEDMAYKHAPMISPDMFRRYMAPHYRKNNGVDIVFVDCDGYPGGLIPKWLDTGVDGMSPVEIAAGCDVMVLRRVYPNWRCGA
jgi:uroporphyrinogen decarboxylase